MMFRSIC